MPDTPRADTPTAAVPRKALELLAAAQGGDRRAIAKLISLVEQASGRLEPAPEERAALAGIYRASGSAHIVGVTGPPGAGKSSLVTELAKELRQRGVSLGILAIDPSSPFSGGAILGDRVRMGALADDDGVFIRSLATQGAMGGLARPVLDAADVLDASGFEMILIETVGVGQDEVDVAEASHTVIVASPPGLGDGIQAMKAGVLEIADIHVVTKGDRPGAARTAADLKGTMGFGLSGKDRGGWKPPVLLTSAVEGDGLAALSDAIAGHREHLRMSDLLADRQARIARLRVTMALEDNLRRRLKGPLKEALADAVAAVADRETDPGAAAATLMADGLTRPPTGGDG